MHVFQAQVPCNGERLATEYSVVDGAMHKVVSLSSSLRCGTSAPLESVPRSVVLGPPLAIAVCPASRAQVEGGSLRNEANEATRSARLAAADTVWIWASSLALPFLWSTGVAKSW